MGSQQALSHRERRHQRNCSHDETTCERHENKLKSKMCQDKFIVQCHNQIWQRGQESGIVSLSEICSQRWDWWKKIKQISLSSIQENLTYNREKLMRAVFLECLHYSWSQDWRPVYTYMGHAFGWCGSAVHARQCLYYPQADSAADKISTSHLCPSLQPDSLDMDMRHFPHQRIAY